jgi:hypothetical protein
LIHVNGKPLIERRWLLMNVQKLFDRYNKRFWKGKLRGWAVDEVHCSDTPADQRGEYGSCDNETREIFIQIGLSSAEKRKTLLHEMCHAATGIPGESHGQSWQKEMFRIDGLGALGMMAEARSYARKRAAEGRK